MRIEIIDMPSCNSPLPAGGFNQFSVDCPSLCTATTHNMPSPPLAAAAPVNLTPTQPSHHPAEPRACKTPTTSSSTPCSPRLPLLRRNRGGRPALSLPNLNLKCMNSTNTNNCISPATEDYKATMKKSSGSKTPSHSLHSGGRSSNSHQHTQHQRSSSTPTGGLAQDSNGPVRLLPHLYIGSNYHASRQSVLEDHGITAVLNVSRLPNYFPTSFRYMQIPVDDNTDADLLPWFEESTDFIESVERRNGRVLVHCHAGISRSATICLAYLMKVRGIRLEEAFEIVRSERTIISPNLSFMIQLLRFQDDLASSRKENVAANSPCNHNHNGVSSFFNGSTNHSSSRASKYHHHLSPSFAESKSTTMSALSSPLLLSENGTTTTRQLCLGNSALLMKRMSRSVSLPLPLQLPISHSKSQCSSPASRKTSLAFDFNLSVLPKSCSMECPDLSPTPSPMFSPM